MEVGRLTSPESCGKMRAKSLPVLVTSPDLIERLKMSISFKFGNKCNPVCGFSVKVAEISCSGVSSEQIKARLNYQAYDKYDELNLNLHA